jgi:hypothetical protein
MKAIAYSDRRRPRVSITSPANGATVRGTVTITASVTGAGSPEPAHVWHSRSRLWTDRQAGAPVPHQSGIERVEFYVNGGLLCTDTEAPYTCEWDTMGQGNGPAQICAKAFDQCGRSAQAGITVTVRNQTFEDVPPDNRAWLAIETIAARGITSGCSLDPHVFCPYAYITRAQLAVMICRAAGKTPLDRATPTFADVAKTLWAYGYIERFCEAPSWAGNAPGYACSFFPSKRFCPGAAVTREQIAWILCTAAGQPPMPSCSGTFADVPSSNALCRWIERLADAASWPATTPVTSGCACPSGYPSGAKCYCPKSPVTRVQMALFLVRALGISL